MRKRMEQRQFCSREVWEIPNASRELQIAENKRVIVSLFELGVNISSSN